MYCFTLLIIVSNPLAIIYYSITLQACLRKFTSRFSLCGFYIILPLSTADFKVTIWFDSKSILEFYVYYYKENSNNKHDVDYFSAMIFIAHVAFRIKNNDA